MGWSMILKSFLMMTVKEQLKQKVRHVSREEVYTSALYVPLVFFFITAPTLFMAAGLLLFGVIGIAQFIPNYSFPIDFMLVMASASICMSLLTYVAYIMGLKRIILKEKIVEGVVSEPLNIEDKLAGVFAPIKNQFLEEQNLFIKSMSSKKH